VSDELVNVVGVLGCASQHAREGIDGSERRIVFLIYLILESGLDDIETRLGILIDLCKIRGAGQIRLNGIGGCHRINLTTPLRLRLGDPLCPLRLAASVESYFLHGKTVVFSPFLPKKSIFFLSIAGVFTLLYGLLR